MPRQVLLIRHPEPPEPEGPIIDTRKRARPFTGEIKIVGDFVSEVKPGQLAQYKPHSGVEINIDDETHVILEVSDILFTYEHGDLTCDKKADGSSESESPACCSQPSSA